MGGSASIRVSPKHPSNMEYLVCKALDMADDPNVGTPAESPLAPAILRGLGDRSYDKRKNAALEIEALIKTLEDNNETDRICAIIVLLGQDFATSTNPNHRKGGLIGLAASSIGLMSVRMGGACRACVCLLLVRNV